MPVQGNVGDIVRIVVRMAHPQLSAIENVFHCIIDGTGTCLPDDILDAVGNIIDPVYGALAGYISDDTTFESVLCNLAVWAVDKWLNVGSLGDAADRLTSVFTSTAGVLPDANSMIVRHVTDVPRRTGAKYMGPMTSDDTTINGVLNASAVTALLNSGLAFVDAFENILNSSNDLMPVVLSPAENIYTFPTGVIARSEVAYQRRRKTLIGL